MQGHNIRSSRGRLSSTPAASHVGIAPRWRRAAALRVQCVQQQQQHAVAPSAGGAAQQQEPKQAVLCTKFKAHDASVTALAVLKDAPGSKAIVTASLDKTLGVWAVDGCGLEGTQLSCTRLEVPGAPVFSLHRGIKTKVTDVNIKPRDPVLFCGLAGKEIVALHTDSLALCEQMHMNGHTGWVRSLASSGKYLFSCGCNNLHQWDQAYAVPKEVRSASLFTGDILAIAATSSAVFTAGADGSLRSWALGKKGDLVEAAAREKAHEGRITALAVSGSLLYSAGYDGHIKAWEVPSLKLVMEVKAAHAGERIRALVMGPAASSSPAVTPSSSQASSPSGSSSSTPASSPPPSPSPPVVDAAAASGAEATQAVPAPAAAADDCEAAPAPAAAAQETGAASAADAAADVLTAPTVLEAAQAGAVVEPKPPAGAAESAAAAAGGTGEAGDVLDAAAAPAQEAAPEAAAGAAAPAAAAPAVDDGLQCLDVCSQPASAPNGAAAAAGSGGADGAADADGGHAGAAASAPPLPQPSPSPAVAVLYSGGDDGLVRRWDARLLEPLGEPLQVHQSAVKALAVGDAEVLVSGDAAGEVAVWLV